MLLDALLSENRLNINCQVACMIHDREGLLDRYSSINLNCGTFIGSEAVHAKLLSKGANLNSGDILITEYEGEFLQISGGTIGGDADFSGKFIIASGDLVLRGEGVHAFEKAAGAVVTGTVYYPESCDPAALAGIRGQKRPYPENALVVLGSRELGRLLTEIPDAAQPVWVAGEVSVLERGPAERAKDRGLRITCDRLVIRKELEESCDGVFSPLELEEVPEGFAVTGPLTLNEAAVLYGDKLYVRGPLLLEEKDRGCLGELQAIRVRGCASLPASCVRAFKAIGKADSYRLFEGRLVQINGWEYFSHEMLGGMVERGERITLEINGFAVFDEDVTAEDMDAIASLSCNGFLVMPGAAQGAVSQRMGGVNGFTADTSMLRQMTGMSLEELMQKAAECGTKGGNINTEVYFLP